MLRLLALAALVSAACALDTSHRVNVAPSAHAELPLVLDAVDRLNEMVGADVFSVYVVDSGHRLDNEIVVRVGDTGEGVKAYTVRTRRGVIIVIRSSSAPEVIAHELGHAVGLNHAPTRGNLMYRNSDGIGWQLTQRQLERLRGY